MNFKEKIIEIMESFEENDIGGGPWHGGGTGIPIYSYNAVAKEIEAMIERHIATTYHSN